MDPTVDDGLAARKDDGLAARKKAANTEKMRRIVEERKQERLVGKAEVCFRLGISPATLWRWTRSGRWPVPIELSPQLKKWLESVLDREIEKIKEAADVDPQTA